MRIASYPCLAALAAAFAVAPAPSAAETHAVCTGFIDALPAVISTQGVWCLRGDVATSQTAGAAVTIQTNNVTIDCNGFKIGGLAAGPATQAVGIESMARMNATVRGCGIRGFAYGLRLFQGGGHLVEDSRFDGNTVVGIIVYGDGSTVRRNRVFDTGGTAVTGWQGNAIGIEGGGAVDVLDNTVSNVVPSVASNGYAAATGIALSAGPGSTATGNRIRGLVGAGEGGTAGILINNSPRTIVAGNHVLGDSDDLEGIGIHCFADDVRVIGNVVHGFITAFDGCLPGGGNYL